MGEPPVAGVGGVLRLALPLFLARVGWAALKATDSAVLGRVSTDALEASSLSDLWTMSTGVLLTSSVLGTLAAQALGAGNARLVGAWVQVSLAVQAVLMLPVAASWLAAGQGLRALGADDGVVGMAGYYARSMAAALPGRTALQHLTAFLSAQRIVAPAAGASATAAVLNAALGIGLVLRAGLGFPAAPWVTVGVENAQLAALWAYAVPLKRLHERCWPGWDLRKHVTRERVQTYLAIYWPAALSIASDFWRMSAVGALAASIGGLELAVFNTSYRVLWICLIFTGATAGATGITLASALGAGDVHAARRAARAGTLVVGVALLTLCAAILVFARPIARIFSEDEEVLELFHESRKALALATFFMNLTVFLETMPNAFGRTRNVFYAGLVGSWVGQVPLSYIALRYWRKDLVGLYCGVAGGYALACVVLGVVILRTDLDEVADEARERAEVALERAAMARRRGSVDVHVGSSSEDSADEGVESGRDDADADAETPLL